MPGSPGSNNGGAGDVPSSGTSTLYVGDLPISVTEAMLFEKFSGKGQILSIKLNRHNATRRSLGYAYVNYQSNAAATQALEDLNFTEIGGKLMRIMWSQRDPTLRKSGVGNIFIKNLDLGISAKDIFDTFSTFGPILSCKVAETPEGNSKGFGFVHFQSYESAKKAIDKVNGMMLSGKTLYVGEFIPKHERMRLASIQPPSFTNVYVKNIPLSFDTPQLNQFFSPIGEITSCLVVLDKDGNSRGFGFVNFALAEHAQKACEEYNGKELEDKLIFVGRAMKKAERISRFQQVNLYVKNLDDSVTDEALRKEFAPYGDITSCKVMTSEEGRSRGFGFVCFTTPVEANRAITTLHNKLWFHKPLYVGLAQRKDDRRERLATRFRQRFSDLEANMANPGISPHTSHLCNTGSTFLPPMQPVPMHNPYSHQMTNPYAQQRWNPPQQRNSFHSYGSQTYRPPNRTSSGPLPQRVPFYGNQSHRGVYSRQPYAQPNVHRQFMNGPQAVHPTLSQHSVGYSSAGNSQHSTVTHLTSSRTSLASSIGQNNTCPPLIVPQPIPQQLEPLSSTMFSRSMIKQRLGEQVFPIVESVNPELAGKITGMILEMRNDEVEHLLQNPQAMRARIDEGLNTLALCRARTQQENANSQGQMEPQPGPSSQCK